MADAITTTKGSALIKLPTGFGRMGKLDTPEKLITHLDQIESVRVRANQACDFETGKALVEAKELIPHGSYEAALATKGISSQDAHRFRSWYETCKTPNFGDLNPVKAEAKLSRGARTELIKADPEVQEAVIKVINDDDTKKVTAKDIKEVQLGAYQVQSERWSYEVIKLSGQIRHMVEDHIIGSHCELSQEALVSIASLRTFFNQFDDKIQVQQQPTDHPSCGS